MDSEDEEWISDATERLQKIMTSIRDKTWLNCIQSILEGVQKIQKRIFEEIDEWNYCHQTAQVGCPFPEPLNDVQPLCDSIVKVLSSIIQQLKQLIVFNNGQESLVNQLHLIYQQFKALLGDFLKRCLVIEKQPPQVVIRGTQFKVSLRILVNKQTICSGSVRDELPKVSCSLHLTQMADNIMENSHNIKNNEKTFKKEADVLKVTLDKLILPRSKEDTTRHRAAMSSDGHVTERKSRLIFRTSVKIESETFILEALSVPVVVISHTGQQLMDAEATVFWDNAFSVKNRPSFDAEPVEVPFPVFAKALKYRWRKSNDGEPLTDNQLIFLATKLFPEIAGEMQNNLKVDDLENYMVTKKMFHKNNLPDCSFTFWKWFYETMKFVNENLKDEWRKGLIQGFISKDDAQRLCQTENIGTFILRFSESLLGGISAAYKNYLGESTSIQPWTKVDLKGLPLSKCIRDIEQLQYLYPSTPKEDVFPEINSEGIDKNGYPVKKRMRVEIDDGCSPAPSPSQSVMPPFDDLSTHTSTTGEEPFSPSSNLDDDPLISGVNVPLDCSFGNNFWENQVL